MITICIKFFSVWLIKLTSLFKFFYCNGEIIQEFSDRWEVDRYLSASGYLGDNVHPFFVALPKDRSNISNDEFRKQISQVDVEVLRHLRDGVKGGYDEDKFRTFIGFSRLRDHLESELQRRYKEAAPATLALLEQRCSEVTSELLRMDSKLQATSDIAYLRRSAMLYVASISNHVVSNIIEDLLVFIYLYPMCSLVI